MCGRERKAQEVKDWENGENQVVFLRAASESREKTQAFSLILLSKVEYISHNTNCCPILAEFRGIHLQNVSWNFLDEEHNLYHDSLLLSASTRVLIRTSEGECVCETYIFNCLRAKQWNRKHQILPKNTVQ